MESNISNNKILKKCSKLPKPRFGHTENIISQAYIIIFDGAINTPDNQSSYTMTSDLYL